MWFVGGPEAGGPPGGGPPVDRAIAVEDIDVDKSIVITGGATTAAFPNVVRNARRSSSGAFSCSTTHSYAEPRYA